MTEKYYIGYDEVTYGDFQNAASEAEREGNTIVSECKDNGYPEYELSNGTLIRGDKKGHFNRMENEQPQEEWKVGTVNEWVQGEPSGGGKAVFFMPKN